MRQKITHLVHQVDPQIVVGQADVDVHPADQHPLGHDGQVAAQGVVAGAVAVGLRRPVGGRMAGRGNRGQTEIGGDLGHAAPKPAKVARAAPMSAQTFVPTST